MDIKIDYLIGKTLIDYKQDDDSIVFFLQGGEKIEMYHDQDCCERVSVESVTGDWDDILDMPITQAEEKTNREDSMGIEYPESFTWTFYTIGTVKGRIDIRWLGTSNGYYSESVELRIF